MGAVAETAVPNLDVKVYQPSAPLLTLVENVKRVARFDVGIIHVFEQATKIAAVNQLMSMPEMDAILDKLEGSPAGFQTDIFKDGKYYPKKERNMALTQGLALGARLCNKEIAIIRGNAFLGKNYYQRMLDELGHEGSFTEACKYRMMWWDTEIGEISLNGNIAKAEVRITYKVVDKSTGQEIEKTFVRTFQIKTNGTDTPDLWVGKFERRGWQKLLRYLSGVDFGDDGDEGSGPGQGTAPSAPPTGTMSLSKEPAPAKTEAPKQAAADATFTEIVKGPQATSETQAKPYSQMNAEERKAETARVNAGPAKAASTAPATPASPAPVQEATPAPATPPAASGKPELF